MSTLRQRKTCHRLIFTAIILFALMLSMLMLDALPLSVAKAYAHTEIERKCEIIYTGGKLIHTDESDTVYGGKAINLFDVSHDDVNSALDDIVVAPGMKGSSQVYIKNESNRDVNYTVLLFLHKSNDDINLEAEIIGEGLKDSENSSLLSKIKDEHLVRAIEGTIEKNNELDFDVRWHWDYEVDDDTDQMDTDVAGYSRNEEEEVYLGLYVLVDETELYTKGEFTKTGDQNKIYFYMALMCISFIVMLLPLIVRSVRKRGGERQDDQ